MKTALGIGAIAAAAWMATHRRSPAVQAWASSRLPFARTTRLEYRHGGPTDGPGILLLHGMVATGDVFGSTPDELARTHRIVVPDLLGFGRSLAEGCSDFSTSAHLDALDELIDRELPDGPIVVGAHSMGSALALRMAARHPGRVAAVVCIGAPMWPDSDSARSSLGRLGAMSKALLFDERIARRVCHFNCTNRTLAGWLSAAGAPRWPIPIARQASLHTWPAYIQSLTEQIIDCPWAALIERTAATSIPVVLVRGVDDSIGDRAFVERLGRDHDTVTTRITAGDHTLPAAAPALLANLVKEFPA